MRKFNVTVLRTAWCDFEVEAMNEMEAEKKAEELAYNHSWGSEDAEYTIDDVEELQSEKQKQIYAMIVKSLQNAISSDYINTVAEHILDDVVEDVEECADKDDWNEDDVRLAVGRVFIKKMGVDF